MGRSRFCCWLQTAQIPSLFVRLDAQHQQFVDVLLCLPDFLPQLGYPPIKQRLAEGPLLVQPLQVCLLLCPTFPEGFRILHHLCIQAFFPDAVGGAEFFALAVLSLTHIFYPAAAVPVADHRHKGLTAVAAGEKT